MKFETYKSALSWAKLQTIYTKIKHKPVKTQYWSNDKEKYIPCYTVIIFIKKGK